MTFTQYEYRIAYEANGHTHYRLLGPVPKHGAQRALENFPHPKKLQKRPLHRWQDA